MIANYSDNKASKPCFACYNKTQFKKFIPCFQNDLKEFLNESPAKDNSGMLTPAHLICVLFHHEINIVSYIDPSSKHQSIAATNTRKIKKDCYLEDCSICNRSHPTQCMIPCSMRQVFLRHLPSKHIISIGIVRSTSIMNAQ